MGMVWIMTRASDAETASLQADPKSVYDFINSEAAYESGRGIDLDKQWHAVHFLLTGSSGSTDSPLSLILGGFEEIGPDIGYGSAWFVPKAAIAAFHEALSAWTHEQWAEKYDADRAVAEDVYLAETLKSEGAEALEFLASDIGRLRAFLAEAAAAGDNAFAVIT